MISKDKILELWKRLLEQNVEINIEAKRVRDKVGDSVMQTICAFSNNGTGYLLLGVSEKDETHSKTCLFNPNNSFKLSRTSP